jgi:hypothetical protein
MSLMMRRTLIVMIGLAAMLFAAACGSDTKPADAPTSSPMSASPQASGTPSAATPAPGVKAANPQYCAHNADPACPRGSYLGPFVSVLPSGGHWDAAGRPVNGGPAGADGSTGNNLTHEYCARNQDPACPIGTYVAPNAIPNPDGTSSYVVCEGTICTNPNHGGGGPPGTWGPDGQPVNGGPAGADGSTGNNLTHEYCARNQDPACPVGTYVAPNAIPNPNGTSSYVVCEGTICTNPNHGAGDPPDGPLDDGTDVAPGDDTPPPGDDSSPAEDAPAADDGRADQGAPPADQDSP